MIYDREKECMRVTLQMHFTHAHLEPLKAAHSTYVSMYCYGRALGNNPGPVAGGGSLTDVPMPFLMQIKDGTFPWVVSPRES